MSIYKDTTGQVLHITINDHGGAVTDYVLKVKKPSGAEAEWTLTRASDTRYNHTFDTGDLNEAGIYKCQIAFTFVGPVTLLSDTFTFEVKELWT